MYLRAAKSVEYKTGRCRPTARGIGLVATAEHPPVGSVFSVDPRSQLTAQRANLDRSTSDLPHRRWHPCHRQRPASDPVAAFAMALLPATPWCFQTEAVARTHFATQSTGCSARSVRKPIQDRGWRDLTPATDAATREVLRQTHRTALDGPDTPSARQRQAQWFEELGQGAPHHRLGPHSASEAHAGPIECPRSAVRRGRNSATSDELGATLGCE